MIGLLEAGGRFAADTGDTTAPEQKVSGAGTTAYWLRHRHTPDGAAMCLIIVAAACAAGTEPRLSESAPRILFLRTYLQTPRYLDWRLRRGDDNASAAVPSPARTRWGGVVTGRDDMGRGHDGETATSPPRRRDWVPVTIGARKLAVEYKHNRLESHPGGGTVCAAGQLAGWAAGAWASGQRGSSD